ncbi:hypothetical protein TFLX_03452 [Thermoflexales bacterium]|nr:hypothetical protein TFLX_03452 [Thermoflexales bacterium]
MQRFTRRSRRLSTTLIFSGMLLLLSLTLIGTAAAQSNGPQAAIGTAFTYQGHLMDGGVPATGTYDLQFTLYDAISAGMQVGPLVTKDDLPINDGYFTTLLDFGNVFDGAALFMQIAVRPGSSTGSYTPLSPRVSLTAAPFAHYALNNWGLTGNGGLNSSHYLGTRDNLTLTLSVSGTAALRLIPAVNSWEGFAPSLIGGSSANFISPTTPNPQIVGATIAGGGSTSSPNHAGANYATVGGGSYNTVRSEWDTVSGGYHNAASGGWSTVSGGNLNTASGNAAVVGGGIGNLASGNDTFIGGGVYNQASNHYAVVGGGDGNTASGGAATVAGGETNSASANFTFVGGGTRNVAAMQYGSISGGYSNTVATGADYGTIAGGRQNLVSIYEATVGGGRANTARGGNSTIGGGYANTASGSASFIGGGQANVVTPTAAYGVLGGGLSNMVNAERATISGGVYNSAAGMASVIGGGGSNTTIGSGTVIGGGSSNTADGYASTIGGGLSNATSLNYATVSGGTSNAAAGVVATIGGGDRNAANGGWAFVGGGLLNIANGQQSTISGGSGNYTSNQYATIGGGTGNTASGYIATIPGGSSNVAHGTASFAAGTRAKAMHNGAFVWGDSSPFNDVASTAANQFVARASGGVTFFTTFDLSTGVTVAAGSGSWSSVSDRNVKANFAAIEPRAVLQRLAQIPISTWNYKAQDAGIRHIGPMAQDFAAAFGVGEDDTHISTIDADGVSLAAIQGLYQISQEKDQQIAQLQTRLDALENRASPIGSAAPNGLIWFAVGAVIGLGAFWLGSRRTKGRVR